MIRIDSFVIPTALWRFTGIRTRLVFQRLDASCPRDVTGRCQNEEPGMKGSETASAARVIPAQYNPVIPAQYNPVIPAKAGIYGGKGLDPRLRGDDGAGGGEDIALLPRPRFSPLVQYRPLLPAR